tara:strand:+ start:641 stop:784 length:144 start_codon:yes stop_codon:yes gene_type:complete
MPALLRDASMAPGTGRKIINALMHTSFLELTLIVDYMQHRQLFKDLL